MTSERLKGLRKWINKQPHRDLYTDPAKKKNLRTCLLCGNRYPFTARWFFSTDAENTTNLPGYYNAGLFQFCLVCREHWGENFKADTLIVFEEAKENEKNGTRKAITPIASRKH